MRTFIFIFSFLICWQVSLSQQLPIGGWSIHLNFTNINTTLKVDDKIYLGTKTGLFYYDMEDGSTTRFSKLDHLSSTDVTALSFNEAQKALIVGYNDGQIDILKNSGVINIPDIEMASIMTSKTIHHIYTDNELSYLSCPFGLVVLNTEKYEISETYYFSENGSSAEVYASHVFDGEVNHYSDEFLANKIFVATDKGLYYADKNGQLHIPSAWKKDSRIINGQTYNTSDFKIKKLIGVDFGKVDNDPYAKGGGKTLIMGIDIDDNSSLNENLFSFYKKAYMVSPSDQVADLTNCFVPLDNGSNGSIYDISIDINNLKLISVAGYSWYKNVSLIDLNPSDAENHFGNFEKIPIDQNSTEEIGYAPNINSFLLANDFVNSNKVFLSHNKEGLFMATLQDDEIKNVEKISPNGPAGITNGDIDNNGQNIIFTHGGRTSSWNNNYNTQEISFYNNFWSQSDTLVGGQIKDAVSVSKGYLGENHFFVGTWNYGLLEFMENELINIYNNNNTNYLDDCDGSSQLGLQTINNTDNYIRIGGIDMDFNKNIWLTNSQTERPLVKISNGKFISYSVPDLSRETMSGKIMCTQNNQKWIQLRKEGILVARETIVSENGCQKTIIESKRLSASNNNLAGQTVNCFAEDNNQAVWVGTSQGLSVFYFTDGIFNSSPYQAESILIETIDGYVEKLFENTDIQDIAVDEGNRKWIATKSNGVFLMSDDGGEQLENFTSQNSPLLSNNVESISIVDKTGEVFFVTDLGICSYRSDATESMQTFDDVIVFPSPVMPNYSGDIAISGLQDETNVKITDIAGNIVYETYSVGGTATWNGKNFDGVKVATGVYLFMCTSSNFGKSVVKKILIYN
ncbi:MAG: hypothetical protein CMP65_04130 [Flavobacteriales bacterium]|nr:hypothetical protein [Flavobacteriales bacterium]